MATLAPVGPNLQAIVPQWTPEEFAQTIRTGVDPSGHELSTDMPWKGFGQMDDVELGALYTFVTGQPALEASD